MADPYQNSVDTALKAFQDSVQGYRQIEDQLAAIKNRIAATPVPELDKQNNPTGKTSLPSPDVVDSLLGQSAEYKTLQDRLQDASKAWVQTQSDYQTAIQLQDKAKADAKQFDPAGTSRTRLDTVGNQVVAITETADGRGGWNYDAKSPPSKVDIPGVQSNSSVTAAPTTQFILRDGKIEPNPAYKPPQPQAGAAVPDSEYVYDANGNPVRNTAYRPPNADITTTAPKINDPNHPGQLIDNPNYRAPTATVDTTAEYIPDPEKPSSFIKNPNYKSPAERLTPGQQAVDTATGTTAQPVAEANLKKAQADADTALLNLEDARRRARQSPTDVQAQAGIQTAQKGLDLANQNLEQQIAQSANLNPIAVEQARTTLVRTKQSIEQAQLGDLYGRHEQIQQIKSLVQSGDIKPEEADQMVTALNSGTTVFQAQQQAQADRSTARTQDASNLTTRAGVFNNFANSAASIYSQMNSQGVHGSDASGRAFLAMLRMGQQAASQYTLPSASPTDYLGAQSSRPSPVGTMVDMAQQQLGQSQPQPPVASPPPSQPAYGGMNIGSGAASNPQPPGVGAHQVTINIGAPTPVSSGTEGQANPWAGGNTPAPGTTWQNPAMGGGGLISAAAQRVPATEDDIRKAYGATGAGVM